jgi:hypothetical protein
MWMAPMWADRSGRRTGRRTGSTGVDGHEHHVVDAAPLAACMAALPGFIGFNDFAGLATDLIRVGRTMPALSLWIIRKAVS